MTAPYVPDPAMTAETMEGFEPEHLLRWLATTRRYLSADADSLAAGNCRDADGWAPPKTDSHGGRKKFIARVRGRLLRPVGRVGADDPLGELERTFHRQMAFIARHPDVPRRLMSWLAQDDDPGLQRRVRTLIGHYASRLARTIARARQLGLVRADVDPHAAACSLVGLIQGLVLGTEAAPQRKEWLLRHAAAVFAVYRAALAVRLEGIGK